MVLKSRNATLSYILESKWPDAIRELDPTLQAVAWNDLAEVWLELGNKKRAETTLERADQVEIELGASQYPFQTWRTWMNLGDYTRALKAANLSGDRFRRALYKLTIAQALLRAGHGEQARATVGSALSEIATTTDPEQNRTLLQAEEELIDAGDPKAARNVAAQMAVLARKPQILPSAAFITVATAFNDLGDHEQADAWLNEALGRVPGVHQVVGVGVTMGPITGSTLGLRASLRSAVAVQLYRAGKLAEFSRQLEQLPAYDRARTWSDLCDPAWGHETLAEAVCVQGAGPEILLRRAVDAAARADKTGAVAYLLVTIKSYQDGKVDRSVSQLLDCARLARIVDRPDLMNDAMIAAARVADHLTDPSDREVGFAEVAALRKELAA